MGLLHTLCLVGFDFTMTETIMDTVSFQEIDSHWWDSEIVLGSILSYFKMEQGLLGICHTLTLR